MILTAPQNAIAGTTTADFLKWERKAQVSFFQISISMATVIAAQVRPKVAKCLNDWYYKNPHLQTSKHEKILKIMPQYVQYDPTAVLLGYIEGVCGKFRL